MANGKADIVDVMDFEWERKPLNESSGESDEFVVRGVLQRAEAKNQNGRVYPKPILKREAEKFRKERINERRAYGELDHPEQSEVELKHVSHVINSISWRGNDLMGEVQVLPTPMGNILRTLLEQNLNVGISSRGLGSVREMRDGTVMVGEDFDLITFDFVSNPSTQGAFMKPLNESAGARRSRDAWAGVEDMAQEIITEIGADFSA